MNKHKAIQILTALAEGVDPATGEILERGHVCLDTEVRQALDIALDEVKKSAKRDVKVFPVNQGGKWTAEMDIELKSLYAKNKNVKQLAARYGRTTGAIKSRLMKLGVK